MSRKKTVICFLALTVFFFWFQVYRSYHLPTVRRWQVETPKLREAVTLVLLSDLHGAKFGENNEDLLALVRQEAPDVILLCGDMINDDADSADAVLDLVERLVRIAPVYYAWGNHELAYMERTGEDLTAELQEAGAVVTELSWQDTEIRGQAFRIGGMYAYAFALDDTNSTRQETMDPAVYTYLTEYQNTDRFKLMLSHRPESFALGEAAAAWQIDLTASGHAHGGQVVLPFLGGLWAGDQGWFPTYEHGLHTKDGIQMWITAGLGSQRQKLPRFNNPPEIAVCTLLPDEAAF